MPKHTVLLLNASNMAEFPIFPYAFIQVPAIARRVGIEVFCKDLLDIPLEDWEFTVEDLIADHNPSMILITMRNTDSLNLPDYQEKEDNENSGKAYFPIERTRDLINAMRAASDLKIAIGGFGFSLLSKDLMYYLRPDFGVFAGPDDFFTNFDKILAGETSGIANLLSFAEKSAV